MESQRHEESMEESVPRKSSPHQQEESNQGSKEVTITDELQEFREKIEKLENQTSPSAARVSKPGGCPLSSSIVNEPLHAYYKSEKIAKNDGSNDPEKHLARFENSAMLHCYRDQIKCKVFLTTQVDSAQRWFVKLKPGSIGSFGDFQSSFLHHFSSSKRHKNTAFNLFEVKQSTEESLQVFLKRFNRVSLDVPTRAAETKVIAFTHILREVISSVSWSKSPHWTLKNYCLEQRNILTWKMRKSIKGKG